MAVDFREIQLSDEQKQRVAELAEQTGKPWREIVDERLSSSNSGATRVSSKPLTIRTSKTIHSGKPFLTLG